MLTLVSLCYGIASESLMQHSSLSTEDRLPFQVAGSSRVLIGTALLKTMIRPLVPSTAETTTRP